MQYGLLVYGCTSFSRAKETDQKIYFMRKFDSITDEFQYN